MRAPLALKRETKMAETAVGLFEHAGTADAVVDALRESGVPSTGIRIVSKPTGMSVDSATSTPSIDFAAGLAQDLSSMGATEPECEAYLDGLRRGGVLVFATGTHAQAETSAGIMNSHGPSELAEFAGAVPSLPGIHQGDGGGHDITLKAERSRAKSEGARVFTW
jgi:hypothetical protein